MRRLTEQRYLMRRNFIAVVGFCLFAYFTYNILCGERSILRLYALNHEIVDASASYGTLHDERVALENQVVRLRPATLDRDLLEDRARIVLGFGYPNEKIIVTATAPLLNRSRLN